MALPVEQRFVRSSAVGRYWLARCEGFRVRSGNREVGTIEQVRCTSAQGDAYSLVIKSHGRRVSVSVDRVLEVDPWGETIVLAASQRVRSQLSRSAVAATRVSVVTARTARVTADGARRYTPMVLDRLRRAGRWISPHARRGMLIAGRGAVWAGSALAALCVLVATLIADLLAWLRPRLLGVGRGAARLAQSARNRAVSRSTSLRRPV